VSFCLLAAGYGAASSLGLLDSITARLFPKAMRATALSAGDFPAGVSAPVGEIASLPLRPTLIGFTPRGSAAALLLATGGVGAPSSVPDAGEVSPPGLFKSGYALDARALLFAREDELRRALELGVDQGGVDMAAVSVDELARWMPTLRDAAPRVELLLGRSRGQEALAAVGAKQLSELAGKRLAADTQSPAYYFALWCLSRGGLTALDVRWVELSSALEAGAALREGRADAAAGLAGDVALAAQDRGGTVLASSVDAPHLVATVLVTRGDFAARYPDAVRRVLRGLLDAGQAVLKDPGPAARYLGDVAPQLGDPIEAIRAAPPATLKENLAFFDLAGEAPVTYEELFRSASSLFRRIGRVRSSVSPDDTLDLAPLKFVSEPKQKLIER
jgi:hypothetical protein